MSEDLPTRPPSSVPPEAGTTERSQRALQWIGVVLGIFSITPVVISADTALGRLAALLIGASICAAVGRAVHLWARRELDAFLACAMAAFAVLVLATLYVTGADGSPGVAASDPGQAGDRPSTSSDASGQHDGEALSPRESATSQGSTEPDDSTDTAPTSTPAASSTAPARPDGVTYRCTGSAPAGIDISYGPSGSGLQATSLPFTARDSVSASASYYRVTAQLKGEGDVTCTLTVTDAGHTTTSSGTARGGYNIADAQICGDYKGSWNDCN